MCGRGHAWQGACVAGGMCGRGGECMARGHAWQDGHVWQILQDTVNEQAVRILLECILVINHLSSIKTPYCKNPIHFSQLFDYARPTNLLHLQPFKFLHTKIGKAVKVSSFLTDASPEITDLFEDVTKCRFSQAQDNKGESC